MGKAVGVDKFVDGCEDVMVTRDVGEGCRTVLLDPDQTNVLAMGS